MKINKYFKGDIVETQNYGYIEIIGVPDDIKLRTVKFLDTGNIKNVNVSALSTGIIGDNFRIATAMVKGEVITGKSGQSCIVEEVYSSTRRRLVRYLHNDDVKEYGYTTLWKGSFHSTLEDIIYPLDSSVFINQFEMRVTDVLPDGMRELTYVGMAGGLSEIVSVVKLYKDGDIKPTKYAIGSIHSTKIWGDVTVISIPRGGAREIEFSSGYKTIVQSTKIHNAMDLSLSSTELADCRAYYIGKYKVGNVFNSKLYGEFEVIDIVKGKPRYRIIKFKNTGNICESRTDIILRGDVRDWSIDRKSDTVVDKRVDSILEAIGA